MRARAALTLSRMVLAKPLPDSECRKCHNMMSIKFGYEPSSLCGPCATEVAELLARHLLKGRP